jgi:hypothetical protein
MFELFSNIAAKFSFGGHDLTCRDALGGAIGFVSDVNLATHLLHDARMGRFDVAVLVSNDSDLRHGSGLSRASNRRWKKRPSGYRRAMAPK